MCYFPLLFIVKLLIDNNVRQAHCNSLLLGSCVTLGICFCNCFNVLTSIFCLMDFISFISSLFLPLCVKVSSQTIGSQRRWFLFEVETNALYHLLHCNNDFIQMMVSLYSCKKNTIILFPAKF